MNSKSDGSNPEAIINAVQMYAGNCIGVSDSILSVQEISQDEINSYGVSISPTEKPLVMLCKSGMFFMHTKLLITDRHIYYKCLKDSFWTGIFGSLLGINEGKIGWDKVSCLEIADHDLCFGSAYVGHQLKINGEVLGLVRMGSGIYYDEDAIKYLNGLFDFLFKCGILSRGPKPCYL